MSYPCEPIRLFSLNKLLYLRELVLGFWAWLSMPICVNLNLASKWTKCCTHVSQFMYSLWTNCCICVNSFLGSEHAYLCDPCKWTKRLTNVNLYLYFQCTQCLTCMNSFVGSEGADLCKWFPAGITAVGSLPAVYPAVGSQTAGIGERLVTHLTLEVGVPVVWFGFGGGVVLDNGCHLVLALIGRFVWI